MEIKIERGQAILVFTCPREQKEIEAIAEKLNMKPEQYLRELIAYEVNKYTQLLQ